MTYLHILVLAIIQGLAELLPISSSAHVIVAEKLMGLDPSKKDMVFLLVMLHTGTMFAVIVYFWRRWRALLAPGKESLMPSGSRYHFVWMVLWASAATAVVGGGLIVLIRVAAGLHPEELFRNLPLIGAALATVGFLILFASLFEIGATSRTVTGGAAIFIGVVQGLALPFRGFSRSGATISAGFLCGVERRLSEDFSFALAVVLTPAVIGYAAWKLIRNTDWSTGASLASLLAPGLVGMMLAFVAGLVALRLLSAVLEHGGWKYFGLYCLAAAAGVFAVAYAGY
jgi:undecaprenyl-diphosphatase